MPTCPHGHESTTADYCDECGALISAPAPSRPAEPERIDTNRSHRTEVLRAPPPDGELCPSCSTPHPGDARFCESCGLDLTVPVRTTGHEPAGWIVEVSADRAYYDRVAPDGVPFPGHRPASRFPLRSSEVMIGRRSESRGIAPEIDLSGALADPGVSHRHALLMRRADGGYDLVDTGSTNGTTINDGAMPIAPSVPVELADGDRIHLGAWTTITVRFEGPGSTT